MQNYNKKIGFCKDNCQKISTFAFGNQNLRNYDARTRETVKATYEEC